MAFPTLSSAIVQSLFDGYAGNLRSVQQRGFVRSVVSRRVASGVASNFSWKCDGTASFDWFRHSGSPAIRRPSATHARWSI